MPRENFLSGETVDDRVRSANLAHAAGAARSSLRWSIVQLGGALSAHAPVWDELNAREFGDHPLLHSSFINGLLKHFGTGREVLAILTGGGPVAAMCVLTPARYGIWRSFLPSQAQIGPTLIHDSPLLDGLVRALPGFAVQVDLLCHDPRFGALWAGTGPATDCQAHAITISIPLIGDFDDWWMRRPKHLRSNLGRYERRAQREGALRFDVIGSPEGIADAVLRYAALEGAGWKGSAGTALASTTAQRDFYTTLMRERASQGEARAYELWAGNRLAASRLVVRRGRVVVMLKTTFDESLREWAPGRLLLFRAVKDAFRSWPGDSLEFYTNTTQDQLAWADEQRSIQHVCVYRNAATQFAAHSIRRARAAFAGPATAVDTKESLPVDVRVLAPDDMQDSALARLFDVYEAQNFQLGLDWWQTYTQTVMDGSSGARLFVLHRGGRPLAVLPCNVDPQLSMLGGVRGALANYYSTFYSPLLVPDVTGVDLLPLLLRLKTECEPHAPLRFQPMDPDSQGFAALEAGLRSAGYVVFRYPCCENWYLRVDGNWAHYLQERCGELRSNIRRMQAKLTAEGGRVEIVSSISQVARALTAFQAVYAQSWKRPEPVASFIPALVALCAKRGWLRLGIVWLGQQPIAAQLWIVANKRAYIYKLAYDKAHKRRGAGTVLSAALMKHVLDVDGVHEVDYLHGDEPYKRQWMTHRRTRWGLVAYSPRTPAGFVGILREWISPTWQRFRGSFGRGRPSTVVPASVLRSPEGDTRSRDRRSTLRT